MLQYSQFDTDVEATTVMKMNIIGAGQWFLYQVEATV